MILCVLGRCGSGGGVFMTVSVAVCGVCVDAFPAICVGLVLWNVLFVLGRKSVCGEKVCVFRCVC